MDVVELVVEAVIVICTRHGKKNVITKRERHNEKREPHNEKRTSYQVLSSRNQSHRSSPLFWFGRGLFPLWSAAYLIAYYSKACLVHDFLLLLIIDYTYAIAATCFSGGLSQIRDFRGF